MKEDKSNQIHKKLAVDKIVGMVIKLLTDPTTQELFSVLKRNLSDAPTCASMRADKKTREIIENQLGDFENRKKYKDALAVLFAEKTTPYLQTIANNIGRVYNEISGGSISRIPNHQAKDPSSATIVSDKKVDDLIVGDISKHQISDLTSQNLSDAEYRSKIAIIEDTSYFLLNKIWKNTPQNIENFHSFLHPQLLKYRVSRDFIALEEWEQQLIKKLLSGYVTSSDTIFSKLEDMDIDVTKVSLFHRNILDGMIQKNQKEKALEESFYYFNGIIQKDGKDTIMVNHKGFKTNSNICLAEMIDDNDLKSALVKLDKKWDENQEARVPMDEQWNKDREDISGKLPDYAKKILSHTDIPITNLLPKHSNLPESFIEGEGGCPIPIPVMGIPKDMILKVFTTLYPEDEDFLNNGEIPAWFSVGYLVRGSSIKINDQSLDLSQAFMNSGDIYPVLISGSVAVILHNMSQLEKLNQSFIYNAQQSISFNKPHPHFTEMIDMFRSMVTFEYNIYRHIIKGTKSSLRTQYREQFDPGYAGYKYKGTTEDKGNADQSKST